MAEPDWAPVAMAIKREITALSPLLKTAKNVYIKMKYTEAKQGNLATCTERLKCMLHEVAQVSCKKLNLATYT